LLIGVTEFFRQPQAWEILEEKVIPVLVERAEPESEIRVWVPGCSTGKEAYSLAMLLTEQVEKSGKKLAIQIFATDSDTASLAAARSGSYRRRRSGKCLPTAEAVFCPQRRALPGHQEGPERSFSLSEPHADPPFPGWT
jgi:two-component system CheB/CheR fusion protein